MMFFIETFVLPNIFAFGTIVNGDIVMLYTMVREYSVGK